MFPAELHAEARRTLDRVRDELLTDRGDDDHWTGCLSASALSTATAVSALCAACLRIDDDERRTIYHGLVTRGCEWLDRQQNEDGGFGDTDRSHSNIATSYLVLAAWSLSGPVIGGSDTNEREKRTQRLHHYLDEAGGIAALRQRYGSDKTFVVPILNNMAIAGLVPWSEVSPLPFEAAVFPQSMYRFLGMPVVSYAVPALVAIGQAKFLHSGCLPPWSWVRRSAIRPSLRVLRRMQPDSGGYLEATPLTAFVVMSLLETVAIETSENANSKPFLLHDTDDPRSAVIASGLEFLERSMDAEGSWPIDTNLATWVTSLSVSALACDGGYSENSESVPNDRDGGSVDSLVDWLLSCQHTHRHPFTAADPGGWGWTDLSGAVPDADDTPGAMIALQSLRSRVSPDRQKKINEACAHGKTWLLGLQNRDGGWPTFCRGWGKLPFDRSSTDLTAHAMRALSAMPSCRQSDSAVRRGLGFLKKTQREDGSWVPLWFGNQDRPDEDNPVYGTAKVLVDVSAELGKDRICRGIRYLVANQNEDGGWGGGPSVELNRGVTSTVEETALAIEALASLWERMNSNEFAGEINGNSAPGSAISCLTDVTRDAILSGTRWLICAVDSRHHQVAWPIGFYFAKLWYHERLYPLIFTTAALGRACGLGRPSNPDHDDTP